jgi:uncharacterized protein (UPF0254 family)
MPIPFSPSREVPDIPPPPTGGVNPQDAAAITATRDEELARRQSAFVLRRTAIFSGIGGAAGAGVGALVGLFAGNTKKGATYGALVGAVLPHVSEKAREAVLIVAIYGSGGMPRY